MVQKESNVESATYKFDRWNGRCEWAPFFSLPNCSTGIESVLYVKKCFSLRFLLLLENDWRALPAFFPPVHFSYRIYIISCMCMWKMRESGMPCCRGFCAPIAYTNIAYCLWMIILPQYRIIPMLYILFNVMRIIR